MAQPTLHPRQRSILELVAASVARSGLPPTVRELGTALGNVSTGMVAYHLDRLALAGLLIRDDMIARGLTITDAGYAALGRVSPAADAELGRALRRAARRDPQAAGVLAELEVA